MFRLPRADTLATFEMVFMYHPWQHRIMFVANSGTDLRKDSLWSIILYGVARKDTLFHRLLQVRQ